MVDRGPPCAKPSQQMPGKLPSSAGALRASSVRTSATSNCVELMGARSSQGVMARAVHGPRGPLQGAKFVPAISLAKLINYFHRGSQVLISELIFRHTSSQEQPVSS